MNLDKSDIFLHYLISVALMSICGAILVKGMPKEPKVDNGVKSDTKKYLSDTTFWLAMIFSQLSFGAFYGFFTIFEHERGITLEQITYLWSIGVLAEIFMFAFQGGLLKKIKPLQVIKIALLSLVLRWLLVHFFAGNIYIAAIAQLTHAINFALFTTAAFLFIYSRYEDKKRAQMHFYGFSYGLGGFLGSIVSGALYGANIFLYSAIFAAISFLLVLIYRPTVQNLSQP